MSKSIIVEGISKKFRIHHEKERDTQERGLLRKFLGRKRKDKAGSDEDFWALRDISFEVNQGERLAVVGRNGAGKSTLLKILSRVMSPTEGQIRIRGRMSSLLEVGTGFHPDLTGRENVYLNGALLGMSRMEVRQKFDAIVDFAEVERFLDTPVKRYSSGMYVRLAFAVSAFLEPDIVVLDEVLSVGDARFQQKSYAKMRELASQGRTVLFVSHSMAAVKDLCESAVLIEHGRIKEKTLVDDAIGDYMRHAMHVGGANMPLETEHVDLLAMHVTQGGRKNPNYNFEGDAPVDVELIYHVKENLQNFRIGFYVKTVFGDMLTRALLADRNPEMENVRPGTYRVKAQIPADFLVAGDYVLEVHGSQFGVQDFFGSNALQPFRIARPRLFNIQHAREQAFGHIYLDPHWQLERISD
ncbi:ATP-binding cassette domain-containing protein [Herbaspirillum sp. C7C2]|uniref:ABC transporter ATP-binding protein n=1 Tax=Herbaspirillum sp. C7C2 TaxID=2736666 RepID=UPI001F521A4B|nr:polysaccharide ABC transporter ATP-binding protein [Herbaspirillum sp. C7C2]MCI1014368.1 ATP-binding cassette domain-containing protein [Herbaspirillum sp. C7C2]